MELLEKDFLIEDYTEDGDEILSTIPITLSKNNEGIYFVDIDGGNWVKTCNVMHAVVLFDLLREGVFEYAEDVLFESFLASIFKEAKHKNIDQKNKAKEKVDKIRKQFLDDEEVVRKEESE